MGKVRRYWTLKNITSNILTVTGAITAVTGCIKQIVDLVGCQPKRMIAYRMPDDGYIPPPPPPPPPPQSGFSFHVELASYYGLILIVVGITIIIISRIIRGAGNDE